MSAPFPASCCQDFLRGKATRSETTRVDAFLGGKNNQGQLFFARLARLPSFLPSPPPLHSVGVMSTSIETDASACPASQSCPVTRHSVDSQMPGCHFIFLLASFSRATEPFSPRHKGRVAVFRDPMSRPGLLDVGPSPLIELVSPLLIGSLTHMSDWVE